MAKPNHLVKGTLDLFDSQDSLARTQTRVAIVKRFQQISGEGLQVQQGSQSTALHRLEQKAWIKAKWKETEKSRQVKFHSSTAAGRAT